MCLYPQLIQNNKYKANKKNGGNIPPVIDKRTMFVPIKCGKCIECMNQKCREWQIRLHEEIKHDNKCQFVTLTFSEEQLSNLSIKVFDQINDKINQLTEKWGQAAEKEISKLQSQKIGHKFQNQIAIYAVRHYLERHRKHHKQSIKHWLVTELGQTNTERIHLHGLIWGSNKNEITKEWQYGNIWVGEYVNERTINYITKYIKKKTNYTQIIFQKLYAHQESEINT